MRGRGIAATCVSRPVIGLAVSVVLLAVHYTVSAQFSGGFIWGRALFHASLAVAWAAAARSPLAALAYLSMSLSSSQWLQEGSLPHVTYVLAVAVSANALARGRAGPICEVGYRLDPVILSVAAVAEASAGPASCLDVARPIVALGVFSRKYAVPAPALWLAAAASSLSWPALLASIVTLAHTPLDGGRHFLISGLAGVYGRWSGSRLALAAHPFAWRDWGFACARFARAKAEAGLIVYAATRDGPRAAMCLGINDAVVLCAGCNEKLWIRIGYRVVSEGSLHPVLARAGRRSLPALASRAPEARAIIIDATAHYPTPGFWEDALEAVSTALEKSRLVVLIAPDLPGAAPAPRGSTVVEVRCCAPLLEKPPRGIHPRLIHKVNSVVASGEAVLVLDAKYYLAPCAPHTK